MNEKKTEELKYVLVTCLGNYGVPAKTRLFRPVAGQDNKKVWPSHEKVGGQKLFVLAKGEKYHVHPRIIANKQAMVGEKAMFKVA